jgi:hypothetical protein
MITRVPGVRELRRCRKWPVSRHYDEVTVNTEAIHNLQWLHCAKPCSDSPASHCGAPLSIPGQYSGICRRKWSSGPRFSPSTSDFLCRYNFTSKVLHISVNVISPVRYSIFLFHSFAHLSIDHQTKRTTLNTSLEPYCYITLIRKTVRRKYVTVQAVSFIVSLSTADLSYKKPASEGTSCDSCHAQVKDKRNVLCYTINASKI